MPEFAARQSVSSAPCYELHVRKHGLCMYELWQVESPATPHIVSPIRIGGLKGRNLDFVEHRVLRRLKDANIRFEVCPDSESAVVSVTEQVALMLGLLFRSLAPMRNRENMVDVADGIEQMDSTEAAYWLGMTMHRRYPRRVLMALRCLLIKSRK